MTDVTSALEAVGALIGERSKFESWIAALESKTDVPAHVLEKVRTDYTGRLRTVLQGFSAHVPSLQTALAEFQSRDAALASQEQASRDEHAEGELRHMVGEFDSQQWEKVRSGHESLLARLGDERKSLAAELNNVQRSLTAAVDAGQRARTVGDGPAADSNRASSPTPAIQQAIADANASAQRESAAAVVPDRVEAAAPAPIRTPAPAAEPARRESGDDELGFLRGTPRLVPDFQSAGQPQAAAAAGAPALRIVSDAPPAPVAAATPSSTDAAKTLRCAECNTMNYATEWYCERCGGELAVL
jgi:hypothetical protein